MICLELNWCFNDPSRVLQFYKFVDTYTFFNSKRLFWQFYPLDAIDRSKISGNST